MNEPRLNPVDTFLLFAVRYGLFAVLFLPFVVVLSYLYPWVSGKIWGYEIIIEVLFPLYVLLAFRRKEYRPAANPFLYAVLIYFAVATVSMILGDMPHRSMWSKPDRLTGMFFQYHLLAFFLMAGSVWRGILKRPITVTVLAATALAVQGAIEVYVGTAGGGERGSATLGNPSYLGQYLVPHVFFAAWLFWQDRARLRRALWIVSGILLLVGILATKSRGALLGLFISALVAALIACFRAEGRLKKWARASLIGFALIVVAFFAADRWPPTHAWLYNQRLSIQYFRETGGPRQLLIENALQGIKARPVLGWGPENFESAYYYYYNPTTIRYSDYETRQDRPHNLILEILVELGIIGLLAYAAIFYFGWSTALKAGEERKFEGAVLVLAIISQIVTNLFIFETPISYMMMFFELAILAAFIAPRVEAGQDELGQGALPAFLVMGGLSLWALTYAVLGTINAAYLTAQMIISLGQQGTPAGQFSDWSTELKNIKTPLLERDVRAVVSNLAQGNGDYLEGEYKPILQDLAKLEWQQADRQQHDYVNGLVSATSILSFWPRTAEEQAALEEADARILRLAPNRQEVYWTDARVRAEKGDLAGAEKDYLHAIELDPAARVPHGQYIGFLVRTFQEDKAMQALKPQWAAIKNDPEAQAPITRAVLKLFDSGKNKELVDLYHASVKYDTRTFEWTVAGALGAIAKGDIAEGRRISEEAKHLYPDKASIIDQYVGPQLEGKGLLQVSATGQRSSR